MLNLYNYQKSRTLDFVRTVYTNKVYTNYPPRDAQLPEELFQIVLGNCLGDGSLYTTKTKGSKLKIESGRANRKYLLHLHAKYKGWILPLYRKSPYIYVPKFTRGTYELNVPKSYMFRTITHPAFNFFYERFQGSTLGLKKGYKPGVIKEFLTEVGFCYWVLDDGSLRANNALVLNTQCFGEEENLQMARELNEKFHLRCTVVPDGEYFRLYISANDLSKLQKLLAKIPTSMRYKVPIIKPNLVYN